MSATEVAIALPDQDEFADRVVLSAAEQLLSRYTLDDEGAEIRVSTELSRKLHQEIDAAIREQAREAAPIVAQQILEEGIQQSDTWGEPRGGVKPLKVVVAEEVKKNLTHSSGKRGEGVLDRLIREEVHRQIKAELQDALNEAKKVVTEAVTHEATEALRDVLAKRISF